MNTKLIAIVLLLLAGCTASQRASIGALGSNHRVTLYSGGKQIGQWFSVGIVHNEDRSDGFYFEDAETRKLVEVSGVVVIEQL